MRGSGLRTIALIAAGIAAATGAARAQTFAIHAVGIDPDDAKQNHGEFYDEAADFSSYCGKASNTQCQLFIDPNPALNKQAKGADLSHSLGAPTSDSVKQALIQALDNAGPGDQVAFTLADHGWVEGGAVPNGHGDGTYGSASSHWYSHDTSCISLRGSHDDICADDIAKIIKAHKKPGTKVLIGGEACFSGAFAALGTQEVCTFTEADRWRMGAGGDSLWSQVNSLKHSGQPLSLEQLRLSGHWANELERGGGFGSQIARTRLCAAGGIDDPTVDWSAVAPNSEDRLTLAGLTRDRGHGSRGDLLSQIVCRFDPTSDAVDRLNNMDKMVQDITRAIAPEAGPIRRLAAQRCEVLDPPADPCSAIQAFELKLDRFQHYLDRAREIHDRMEATQNRLEEIDDQLRRSNAPNAAQLRAERGQLLERYYASRDQAARELRDSYPPNSRDFLTSYNAISEHLCYKLGYPGEPNVVDRAYSLDGKSPAGITQEDLNRAQACEASFHL